MTDRKYVIASVNLDAGFSLQDQGLRGARIGAFSVICYEQGVACRNHHTASILIKPYDQNIVLLDLDVLGKDKLYLLPKMAMGTILWDQMESSLQKLSLTIFVLKENRAEIKVFKNSSTKDTFVLSTTSQKGALVA